MAVDKLVDSTQLDAGLTSVANAIRTKSGTSDQLLFPSGFVSAVSDIPQMTGPLSFLGKDAELVLSDFYSKVDTLNHTDYYSWTPSTTAKVCVASSTLSDAKFTATNVDQYSYYIVWECGADLAYTGTPTQKALSMFARGLIIQNLVKRPSTFVNIQAVNADGTVNQALYTGNFLRYYGTTTGSITYTWAASYGFYFGATAPTISSTSAVSPTITPKTPTMSARCSTTYLSTTNAGLVDQANSKWWIKGAKIYRVKHDALFDGIYKQFSTFINAQSPSLPAST